MKDNESEKAFSGLIKYKSCTIMNMNTNMDALCKPHKLTKEKLIVFYVNFPVLSYMFIIGVLFWD